MRKTGAPRCPGRPRWAALAVSLLLTACGAGLHPRGGPGAGTLHFKSTVEADCMTGGINCLGTAAAAAIRQKAAETAASLGGAHAVVEYLKRAEVEAEVEHCALLAEERINTRRLGGRSPTREQCQEVVGRDANGHEVTRAMQLGQEKHRELFECLQWRLDLLIPGQYLLEPRYAHDSQTGRWRLLSPQEVQQLLASGRGAELLGSIAPDLVLHFGLPLSPKAVFEFKFPCPPEKPPALRSYPSGHPHRNKTQLQVYADVLGVSPSLVTPVRGINP